MKSFGCIWTGDFRSVKWLLVLLWIQPWVNFFNFIGVNANFNFYLDRREFQKLHGISSDIYYVRVGVVNEYATSFLVTVPAEVDDLNFSWQALNKRPIYYEMTIDYKDFFALLPPICNISNTGRVPQSLEVFRVTLPCSGRSNAEVSVTIRIVFQIKHPKPNTTTINIKRNKICLLKETTEMKKMGENIPAFPAVAVETNPNPNRHHNHPSSGNGTIFFQDPTPSLLLAGLLGGCGVTASAVFLTFFICLRRKLTPILPSSSVERSTLPGYTSCHAESDQGSSSNNSSPACLLRQSQATGVMDSTNPSSNWKHFGSEKFPEGDDRLSRSGSHNSYITIASFWNDIFSPGNPNPNVRLAKPGHQSLTSGSKKYPKFINPGGSKNSTTKGSDVSPYAYAHVCPTSPLPPPLPKIGAPPLIEWYSQFPCQTSTNPNTNSNINNTNNDKISHVYSNNLHTFNPKSGTTKFSNLSSLAPKISSEYESPGHNNTSTINSTTGSLIQIDGFQCRRNLTKEENVVERFL